MKNNKKTIKKFYPDTVDLIASAASLMNSEMQLKMLFNVLDKIPSVIFVSICITLEINIPFYFGETVTTKRLFLSTAYQASKILHSYSYFVKSGSLQSKYLQFFSKKTLFG